MAQEDLSAEVFLARGVEAYQQQSFEEAAELFEKAAAIDPHSARPALALGATHLTLYQRRPSPVASYFMAAKEISHRTLTDCREKEKTILAEYNSTTWPSAEQSLKRANQLEPQNAIVVEYLCALYFFWKDPLHEESDRLDEAKQWLECLLELEPEHKHANFYCGMILIIKARKLMPNYGQGSGRPEPDTPSLRSKVDPLLAQASRHLARSSAPLGEQTAASHLMDEVSSMRAYLANPEKAKSDLREKLAAVLRKPPQPDASTGTHVAGDAGSRRASAMITFSPSPEALAEATKRPFPPDPWTIPVR